MIKKIKIKINNRGFVILFAVTLSALILAIALGVSDIAYKELKFSTNARDANDAFFAANTGAECALFYETSGNKIFQEPPDPTTPTPYSCNGEDFELILEDPNVWSFKILGLGSEGKGCVNVRIEKIITWPGQTKIISKGYNYGGGGTSCAFNSNTREVEREVTVTYPS